MSDVISSVKAMVGIVCASDHTGLLYRGEANHAWPLLNGLGRRGEKMRARGRDPHGAALHAMRVFKSEYRALYPDNLVDNFEMEALAQHHGVPTRLIDWSLSPLVALYFSVESATADRDAALYMLHPDQAGLKWIDAPDENTFESHKCDAFVYMPRHIDARLRAQQGVFTCHADPKSEFKPTKGLQKFRIPARAVAEVKFELMQLGIGARNIYPDLGGLSQYLKFKYFDGMP